MNKVAVALGALAVVLVTVILNTSTTLWRPIQSRNQAAPPLPEMSTTTPSGLPKPTSSALKVEDCGRVLYISPQEYRVAHVRTILSALNFTNNCLGGIRQKIGIATVTSGQHTFLSFFDRDDARQSRDPFNQSIYVFYVSGDEVYYQSQVDGTFSRLRDPRPLP